MADCYFLPFEFPERAPNRTRRVWVAPVSSRQQDAWGTLAAVVHLPAGIANADRIFNELCDLFTSLYYPTSHVPRGKLTPEQLSESRNIQFEEVLQELNTTLTNPERFGLGSRGLEEFDILLAVIHSDEILVSNHRRGQAWFLGNIDNEHASEGDRLECLTRSAAKHKEFFSDVTSGNMEMGETLILASEGFFTVWSPDTIAHLVDTAKSTEELLEVLEQSGSDQEAGEQAALFILGLNPEELDDAAEEPVERKAAAALPDARALAQQAVLSVTPLFQSVVSSTKLGARWSLRASMRSLRWMIDHRNNVPEAFAMAWTKIRRVLNIIPSIILGAWSLLRTFALLLALGVSVLIVHKPSQEGFIRALEQERAARLFRMVSSETIVMPWIRSISVGLIVFILLGAGGLTRLQYERTSVQEKQQQTTITEKTTQAQARLIYGNDTEAKTLLEEARLLLNQLPERSGDPTKASIAKEVEELSRQLRHEIELTNPTATVKTSSETKKLAFSNGTLVAASPTSLAIYDGRSLKTKNIPRTVALPPTLIKSLDHVEISGSTVLLHDGNRIHKISLIDKKPTPITITLPKGVGTVHTVYSGRLYSTDTTARQILRLNQAGNGWSTPTAWMDKTTTLPNGITHIGVDGSVFITTANSISKYYTGKPEAFTASIEPSLQNPQALIVTDTYAFLFVTDEHNRIVVIDKGEKKAQIGGRTVAQLVNPRWTILKDAVIDTKSKIVTVLVNGTIEQYPLPTLK